MKFKDLKNGDCFKFLPWSCTSWYWKHMAWRRLSPRRYTSYWGETKTIYNIGSINAKVELYEETVGPNELYLKELKDETPSNP